MKFPTDVEPLPAFSTAFRSWSAACWIGAQWDLKTLVWLGVGVSTCFFFLPKIKKGQCLPVKFIGKHIPSGYLAWPWKITIFKNGKPSVSMGHLYHGKLLNNQRVQVMNLQIHILEFKSVVFQRTTKKTKAWTIMENPSFGFARKWGIFRQLPLWKQIKMNKTIPYIFCLNYKWCVFQIYLGVSYS